MMADPFSISVDLAGLMRFGGPMTAEMLPNLALTVQRLTEYAHKQWVGYAHGAPLPSGRVIHERSGEYARSILVRQLGPFSAEVYSDLSYAKVIEEGAPARDLKKMLHSSWKTRRTKDGRLYLIIPFRHFTPGAQAGQTMPESIYAWWNQEGRASSSVATMYQRATVPRGFDIVSHRRMRVTRRKYEWGSRLGEADIAAAGVTGQAAKRLEGMYRFRPMPGAKQQGPGIQTKFITFRTMIEGSKGWNVPAQEGKWPARTVAEQLKPLAEAAFEAAVAADIGALLGA